MKYVECVLTTMGVTLTTCSFTKGKIYEVINYAGDWIRIINDDGNEEFYYLKDTDGIWFVDATALIREQKLKQLLG
jgi:hypothetical protein